MANKKTDKTSAASDSNVFGDFFGKILAILGWDADPDREKKQMLKELKKTLKATKGKWIDVNGDQADVGLAKFFYEIYTVVGPAQSLLANANASGALKSIIIEQHLTDMQRTVQEELAEDKIRAAARTKPFSELEPEINSKLVDFMAGIDIEVQKRIDQEYNTVLTFLDFLSFNYHFLLKKFDAGLPERDFNYQPRFEAISGDYVVEDLKEFIECSQYINQGPEWDSVFDVLKAYKNMEVLDRNKWRKALATLTNVRKSNLLNQIVIYLSKDTSFKPLGKPHNEKIVENYMTMMKTNLELTLTKLKNEHKNDKVNQLVKAVFGTTGISRTKNYTEKGNLNFQKKMLGGFMYVEPVNYLKAFLLDYYKRDIREIINLLLIKGQWMAQGLSTPMSEAFHTIMELSDALNAFDDSLAEDAERGTKLKGLLMRAERDPNAMTSLKQQLKDINTTAKTLIIDCANNLITIGKGLKTCIDDYARAKHETILNWKALEAGTEKELKVFMPEVYKTIYYFVQLMQFFIKEGPQ